MDGFGLEAKVLRLRRMMTNLNLLRGIVLVLLRNGITVLNLTSKRSFLKDTNIRQKTIPTRFLLLWLPVEPILN